MRRDAALATPPSERMTRPGLRPSRTWLSTAIRTRIQRRPFRSPRGLTTSNVLVEYQNYNGVLLSSKASVSIINYNFQFSVPLIGGSTPMPAYRTSLPGESVGFVPCDTPTATPLAPCPIVPTFPEASAN